MHRFYGRMLGEDEQWLLLTLVFGRADGKTLSTCCCVSKQWSEIARQEQFWKDMCSVRWPSLGAGTGFSTIRAVGGYQKYYALRIQAQEHVCVPRRRPLERRRGMEDLVIFLDVVYDGTSICSFVKGGEELKPLFTAWNAGEGVFRFGLDFPELKSPPHSNNKSTFKKLMNFYSSLSREDCKGWTEIQVKDLQINWAVMEKSTHKMLQLLQVNKGSMVGSTCTFKDWLPGHSYSPTGNTNYIAEVDVICQCIPKAAAGERQQQRKNDGEESLMVLQQLNFGFMICQEWRYFTQLQACRYLQHIFDHEM